MKTLILIAVSFLIIGCTQATKGYISYKGKFCECDNDTKSITLFLNKNNSYECKCNDKRVDYIKNKNPIKKYKPLKITKRKDGCETTITEIYTSKASGTITICKGKILKPGQESKIIEVKE